MCVTGSVLVTSCVFGCLLVYGWLLALLVVVDLDVGLVAFSLALWVVWGWFWVIDCVGGLICGFQLGGCFFVSS